MAVYTLVCQIAIVVSISRLIEALFYQRLEEAALINRAAVIVAEVIGRWICDRMASRVSYLASVDVKRILRGKIYEKLLKLGAGYRSYISSSELVQMTAEGVEQLEIYFGRYLSQLFYSMLAPLALFVFISRINMPAALVLLICVPLIPASIVAVQKIAKRLLSKYWGIYTGLGDSFLESLQGLTTLKIYQADEARAGRMDEEAETFRKITMKVLLMQLNSTSVMDIVTYGGAAVGMLVALIQFRGGAMELSGVLIITLLASEFFIPMRLLGSYFHIAMNGMAASDKMFAFLDLPEEAGEKAALSGDRFEITASGLSFSYPAQGGEVSRPILKEVHFHLDEGSFVSIVGQSGSGKSTIANIIMGRNKGYEGRLTIGGCELSQIAEAELMKKITRVSHDSRLFKGSIRENLLLGNPKAEDCEMIAVLKEVNLMGFLEEQQGLDTLLTENSGNLSGGQKQRLALARALLHDSPVYIFDEATSNIDVESEEAIMETIRKLAKQNKTILLISHRLANVVDSDCIYMLSGGCIAEEGTHRNLIEKNGDYARLFQAQQELEHYGLAKEV